MNYFKITLNSGETSILVIEKILTQDSYEEILSSLKLDLEDCFGDKYNYYNICSIEKTQATDNWKLSIKEY